MERIRWSAVGVAGLTPLLTVLVYLAIALGPDPKPIVWGYNVSVDAFNDWDHGLIRRGLGGSIGRLFSNDPVHAAAWFFALSAVAFTAISAVLLATHKRTTLALAVLTTIWLVAATRLAHDFGRTDLAVAAGIALAAWLASRGRLGWAAVVIAVTAQFHELAYVLGGPVMVAVLLLGGRWRRIGRLQWIAAAVATAAGFAAVLAAHLNQAAHLHAIVADLRSRLPETAIRDMAIYFQTTGARGLAAARCQTALDPDYISRAVIGGAVLVFVAIGLTGRRVLLGLLASGPAYLFLAITTTDLGRWTVLGVLATWIVAALDKDPPPIRFQLIALVAALCVIGGRGTAFEPTPTLDRRPFTGTMMFDRLTRCDPDWRNISL